MDKAVQNRIGVGWIPKSGYPAVDRNLGRDHGGSPLGPPAEIDPVVATVSCPGVLATVVVSLPWKATTPAANATAAKAAPYTATLEDVAFLLKALRRSPTLSRSGSRLDLLLEYDPSRFRWNVMRLRRVKVVAVASNHQD